MGDTIAGKIKVELQPGYREVYGTNSTTSALVYKGRLADLRAMRPSNGSRMPESGLYVDECEIQHVAGSGAEAVGTLTINLSDDDADDGNGGSTPKVTTARDFDDGVERDIRLHPIYAASGTKELTNSDRAQVALWETEENFALRAAYKFKFNGTEYTLGNNAQHLALRLLRGQETYRDVVVRARKTTLTRSLPDCAPVLRWTSTKPFDQLPDGLKWLLVRDYADRSGRRGKWARNQEWLGLSNLDTDLYLEAT